MRNFMIAVFCLAVLIGVWTGFDLYSDKKIDSYSSCLENTIIKAVEAEDWKTASQEFDTLSKDWHHYKKAAAFFLDTASINDADYSIARAQYYIKAKDISNSSGELACLKEQLAFLHENESVSWGNIF